MKRYAIWTAVLFFIVGGCLLNGWVYDAPLFMIKLFLWGALLITWMLQKEIRIGPIQILIVLFTCCYVISIFYAVDIEQALIEASRNSLMVPLSLLSAMLTADQDQRIAKIIAWSGIGLFIWGIVFHLFREGRLESTLQYANALAAYFLVSLLYAMWLIAYKNKLVYLFQAIILLSGILLTYSRFIWILTVVVIAILFSINADLRKRKVLVSFAIGGLAAAGGIVLSAGTGSIEARLQSIRFGAEELQLRLFYWKDAIQLLKTYWWKGTGGGGWSLIGPVGYFVKYVHNQYLQIALDVGVLGLLCFLGIAFYYFFQEFRRNARYVLSPISSSFSYTSILAIGSILVHASFDITLSFPLLMGLFIILISYTSSGSNWTIVWNGGANRTIFPIVLGIIVLFNGWLMVAYIHKEYALRMSSLGKWEQAQRHYKYAGYMVPWSNTIPYESGKSYILEGNEKGDKTFYLDAEMMFTKALNLVPKNGVYKNNVEKLEKIMEK
jgi:O-antigen ligase